MPQNTFDHAIATQEFRQSVKKLNFLGQVTFPARSITNIKEPTLNIDTTVGGLSGITYDPLTGKYYSISDDRGQYGSGVEEPGQPARFYTINIDLSSGSLPGTGVTFEKATALLNPNGTILSNPGAGNPLGSGYPKPSDTEGISITRNGSVFISSEGSQSIAGTIRQNPFVNEFDLKTGKQLATLPIPSKFIPDATTATNETQGTYDNLAFESLTITPNQKFLYTASESALKQDGLGGSTPTGATTTDGSRSRILKFDLTSRQAAGEFLYNTDPLAQSPVPANNFATQGLVDLLALDDGGTLLALERSYSIGAPGTGYTVKLYEVTLDGATDISNIPSLNALTANQLAAIKPAQKRLLLNLDDLKLSSGLDNIEGLTLGPVLPNGQRSLILVSDDNFNKTGSQITQFIALGLDVSNPGTLPNNVASGDTTQTSTVLWTHPSVTGNVTFEYSTSPDFSSITGTTKVNATDVTVPVKVNITGLTGGTTYYYRATDAAGIVGVGRLQTAASVGNFTGLRFGVTGDWRGELAPYPSISNAASENLAFMMLHGDTIYADYPSPNLPSAQAKSLADFRTKQNEVYSTHDRQNTLGNLRATTSILATIDDHEVTDNFSGYLDLGTASTDTQALFGATSGRVNQSPVYKAGLQAFQEYNPLQDQFYGQTGDPRTQGQRRLYRYENYGSDASVSVLEERSFRDGPITPVTNVSDTTQVSKFLAASFNPNRTILGKNQLADLKRDLLDAENKGTTWKFVMVPEPIQNLGVLGAEDRFEGYAAERTELLKFIKENDINNVVFVSADIHGTLVNNLTYQEAPGGPQIATSAFDISTGSVAFDAPFGPTVAGLSTQLGFLTPTQYAQYQALPRAGKDAFIKNIVNTQIKSQGYDPLGLDDNLSGANGLINAKLLQGDYIAANSYGWTEFNIDKTTQKLTVTTFGIDPYTQAESNQDPEGISNRTPQIVSQFEVTPTVDTTVAPTSLTRKNDFFTFNGSTHTKQLQVQFSLQDVNSKFVNEIGVVAVEDSQGTVNGIAPGASGYNQAVLNKGQIVFSALPDKLGGLGTREINFKTSDNLLFYLLPNTSTEAALVDIKAGKTPKVLFSSVFGNQTFTNPTRVDTSNSNKFQISWSDQSTSDQNANNLVVNFQTTDQSKAIGTNLQGSNQQELIDLRGLSGSVAGNLVVNSDAAYNNNVGFYTVDTTDGQIGSLKPGDIGYAKAAIQRQVISNGKNTSITNQQFNVGVILAPFIISNGTVDSFLSQNSDNKGIIDGPVAYFSYLGANPDQMAHVRLLGDNMFSFEDLLGGGDRDYNDIVLQINNLHLV